MDGATRARIAETAGISPSAVHHFVGTRDEVIRAAVTRALHRVTEVAVDAFAALPTEVRLEHQLDALFGPRLMEPEVNQLVDELIAHSYRDEPTRAEMSRLYRRFADLFAETIDAHYPDAPTEDRRAVTYGLLALAHANPTLAWLNLGPGHDRQVRAAADFMLAGLSSR